MNKKTILWAVAGVALIATATMAGPPYAEGEVYIKADPTPQHLVSLPTTTNGGGSAEKAAGATAATTKPGPVGLGSNSAIPGRTGSAIVVPRGSGALYTPRQQADREISRLIRKLG